MDWKTKLTSRKFWAAIVNFVTQLMIAFKATDSEAAQVAAVIMAGAGVIAYIVGEGMADAAGATVENAEYHIYGEPVELDEPDTDEQA